ncbi:cysteine-rich receptor-like protein kinase [Tanacetum coccineum]
MRELREVTFSGNKNEDAHEHVERILDILDIVYLFNFLRISETMQSLLRLRLYSNGIVHHLKQQNRLEGKKSITSKKESDEEHPYTRLGKGYNDPPIQLYAFLRLHWKRKLKLPPGRINTWDMIKKAFIQRYCLPSKMTKQLEKIHNFKKESDETLYQAWERYNDLLHKCPTHDLNIHQKKWHDGSNGRKVGNGSSDGIAAIANKLDSLGRYMKKLKDNVHAIQVGCKTCGGAHLDKECPLREDVKSVEEVKYGEFGRSFLNNNGNSARYRIGPPGCYTRVDNCPHFVEKTPNLKELMNKHLEESTRRRAKMEDWMKKLQESTNMNIRNQNASLKNLETQVEQLTKDYQAKVANEAPNSSIGQCKVIYANDEATRDETSYNGTNKLHRVSFITDDNVQVSKKMDEGTSGVLPCQLLSN